MASKNDKIKCIVCGKLVHSIELHLRDAHPEMNIEEYAQRFPKSPVLSEYAQELILEKRRQQIEEAKKYGKPLFHEFFELDDADAFSTNGNHPISITVNTPKADEEGLIPEINNGYVFNVKELKYLLSGIEMSMPVYVWGHKGAGKTELIEQICARTRRPLIRVQHTVNTEESQIVGQWTVRNGQTEFEYGALPLAMINGWTYLADEYDFAMPNVLATYQAVLEGKPLMIKEAPADKRVVKPHPNFRFVATGNTNGTGDETGLYQGTTVQNSANYDRFGVVVKKAYLDSDSEIKILTNNTQLSKEDAKLFVGFAKQVREAFDAGKISDTISPRTLLFAVKLGIVHASFRDGLRLAFMNKLSSADYEVCDSFAQRIFGEG